MPEDLDVDDYRDVRAPKRRSNRACQSCRSAKTKCVSVAGESHCQRCLATASPCFFLASRRGRIKGSKNRRTLEKLREEQMSPEFGATGGPSGSSDDHISPASDYLEGGNTDMASYPREGNLEDQTDTARASHQGPPLTNRGRPGQEFLHQSGTATPWNPHSLAMNPDPRQQISRGTLARKLLHILGEFPVEDTRSEEGDQEAKDLQDPLWLMAGLADRGWDLEGRGEKRKRGTGNRPTALPSTNLPAEDAYLLRQWTPDALQELEKEQLSYYEHGLLGSKCDVARDLDPVHHGLVTEEKAHELFQAFWKHIQPQWAMLDPDLHTLDYVRNRSALLTTTVLAIGSSALGLLSPTRDGQVAESLRLHTHVEKLGLVVFATGARSIEIVQAQILLCRWGTTPKTRFNEQRWIRAGMFPRMAAEIGLTLRRRFDNITEIDSERAEQLRRNELRTRAWMIINEHRFFTFSGRYPLDLSDFELDESEINEIALGSGTRYPHSLSALYQLWLFDRDVRRRVEKSLAGHQGALSLDAEMEHVKSYIERWMHDNCSRDGDPNLNWHLCHDALSCWLLLAVSVSRKRFYSQAKGENPKGGVDTKSPQDQHRQQKQQRLLFELSTRLFKEALKASKALLMTHRAAILPFAASIFMRHNSRRDLVLRTALRMVGSPGQAYTPTFVREAGVCMLVMLTNNLRSPNSDSHIEGEQEKVPSSGDSSEISSSAQSDEQLQADVSQQSYEHSNRASQVQQCEQTLHNIQQISSCLEPSAGFQTDNDNIFFNISDFPYEPDPSMPPPHAQNAMHSFAPYNAAEMDAWMGPPMENPIGSMDNISTLANTATERGLNLFDPGFGIPVNPLGASQGQRGGQPQGTSNWGLEELSPMNHTAFASSSGASPGTDRSAQKEALLAAVDRLIQLASLMQ